MAREAMEDKFLFIVSSDARVPTGRNYRRIIRRDKAVPKNHNRRQLPIYLDTVGAQTEAMHKQHQDAMHDRFRASLSLGKANHQ